MIRMVWLLSNLLSHAFVKNEVRGLTAISTVLLMIPSTGSHLYLHLAYKIAVRIISSLTWKALNPTEFNTVYPKDTNKLGRGIWQAVRPNWPFHLLLCFDFP